MNVHQEGFKHRLIPLLLLSGDTIIGADKPPIFDVEQMNSAKRLKKRRPCRRKSQSVPLEVYR